MPMDIEALESTVSRACSKCGVVQPRTLACFGPKRRMRDGLSSHCRQCERRSAAAWAAKNRDRARARSREWHERNRDRALATMRAAYEVSAVERRERVAKWAKENADKVRLTRRAQVARRRATDPAFAMRHRVQRRIHHALNGRAKTQRTLDLVGCSTDALREWIEARFADGMTWSNRGDWEIDHVRPLAAFDLSEPSQLAAANHYTNLQPLWRADNRRKGAKVEAA